MEDLFTNSPVFMGILTLALITIVAWFISHGIYASKSSENTEDGLNKLRHIRSIGLFALVVGVLHQLIAWYNIIYEIEQAGDITAAIVISALKTTLVPLIYGIIIYLVSLILWFVSKLVFRPNSES